MNIPYRTAIAVVSCSLLFSACSWNKARVKIPYQEAPVATEQEHETVETMGSKDIIVPYPINMTADEWISSPTEVVQTMPEIKYVEGRIYKYGRKLERWKELDEQMALIELDETTSEEMVRCFRELRKVLNGYNRLHEFLLSREYVDSGEILSGAEIMDLEHRDITFLESGCGQMLKSGDDSSEGWESRAKPADLSELEDTIESHADGEEYELIIKAWEQIPESQLDRVHLNSRILYGNALMTNHEEDKAAIVYQQIVNLMSASYDQRTDILSLRKILADLYTASENYDLAEKQYREILYDYKAFASIEGWAILQLSILEKSEPGSAELTEYSALLKKYLGFSPARDGYKLVWQADKFLTDYPYSPVSSNVDIIKKSAQEGADAWLADFLAEVDAMAAEEHFQKAFLKMATLQEDILSGEKLIEVRKKSDNLTLAEAVVRETKKIETMQALQRQWNEALILIERGLFDEGIERLTTMLNTEYSLKVKAKIAEASLLSARAMRRKAADLFLRYTRTTDFETKKKLLIESRRQLADILVKYPNVVITEKVMRNIERVEAEMNTIDPNLISQADLAGEYEDEARVEQDAFDLPMTTPVLPIVEDPKDVQKTTLQEEDLVR